MKFAGRKINDNKYEVIGFYTDETLIVDLPVAEFADEFRKLGCEDLITL